MMSLSNGLSIFPESNYASSTVSSNKVEDTLRSDIASKDEKELKSVCKQFESYLVEQLYKELKNTIPEEDKEGSMFASSTTDYFKDMMTQEYAGMTTEQGGFGLAQTLYESMKRTYNL